MTESEPLNPYILSSLGFSYRRNSEGEIIYYKNDFILFYDLKTHTLIQKNEDSSVAGAAIGTLSELQEIYKAKTGKDIR